MKKLFLFLFLSIFLLLNNCGSKKASKDTPLNALERARKNVEEGRGVSLKGVLDRKSTNYEFSTTNPLWRATLELLDFLPLTTVDYSGGIIITDWYSDSNSNNNEGLKITIRFLTNEIRSDSIKIIVHQRKCLKPNSCSINEINSKIKEELTRSILAKASEIEIQKKDK